MSGRSSGSGSGSSMPLPAGLLFSLSFVCLRDNLKHLGGFFRFGEWAYYGKK